MGDVVLRVLLRACILACTHKHCCYAAAAVLAMPAPPRASEAHGSPVITSTLPGRVWGAACAGVTELLSFRLPGTGRPTCTRLATQTPHPSSPCVHSTVTADMRETAAAASTHPGPTHPISDGRCRTPDPGEGHEHELPPASTQRVCYHRTQASCACAPLPLARHRQRGQVRRLSTVCLRVFLLLVSVPHSLNTASAILLSVRLTTCVFHCCSTHTG